MPQLPLPLPTNRAFVVQLRAQPPGAPLRLGRARRACGVGADDALPLAGRVAGVHTPRPGWRVDTLKRAGRVTGAAAAGGRAPGETVAAEAA